jgi:pilus assembly protein CpaE
MNNELMAFVTDEASVTTFRTWAERQGFPADAVQAAGADYFVTMLESEAPPKIAFVDVDAHEQPAHVLTRLTGLCGPGTKLIALGSANDVTLFREFLVAGAVDYLVKPLTPEMLSHALTAASRGRTAGPGAAKETKIIVVFGVHGGVGATTIATNVGWFIAHALKQKCALVDLDLQFGTTALSLDLEPGHGLREIVSSPQRVDSLMVTGAIVNESDNFSVLSAEEAIDEFIHVDNAAVSMLLKELRPNYRAILVDLPSHLLPTQKRLFALAHEIVMVTEMTLAGIRDTLRVRTALKSLGVNARVTLVAGRWGPQRPTGVDEAAFAKGAQTKIDFFLLDDPKNVAASNNAGKMLGIVAKNAPVTRTLQQLAEHLMGPAESEAGKGASSKGQWGGIFRGRKQAADGAL